MKSQNIVEYAEPLEELEIETPVPTGSEVLLKVNHCGVCHSDVHLHDGFFNLGGEKKLDIRAGRSLPFVLGHEIEGEVVAKGDDAGAVEIGARVVAYPWIGCGACPTCKRGDENLCDNSADKIIGVNTQGGFAEYVIVPDAKYLLDFEGVPAPLAAACMCSGLTAFSAMKKVGALGDDDQILIIGLGGVGMMGLQFARAMFGQDPLVADLSEEKLAAAAKIGAVKQYNTKDPEAIKKLKADTGGGVYATIDFVGSDDTFAFANRVVRKGGKMIVVGLFGGSMSMPLAMVPMRSISIVGSYVGNLQDAKEMMVLVKGGKIAPIPVEERPLASASSTLDDLRLGNIVGRVVLIP